MADDFTISITLPQATLLSQAFQTRESLKEQFASRLQRADEDLNLVASAITAGHGAGPYEVVGMRLDTDPPQLVLRHILPEDIPEDMGITASPDGTAAQRKTSDETVSAAETQRGGVSGSERKARAK